MYCCVMGWWGGLEALAWDIGVLVLECENRTFAFTQDVMDPLS